MEFTKDIKFSNKLIGNEVVGITYSGDLFKRGSDSAAIVYGFGENWEHTTEKEMTKTDVGFTAQIEIKENFDTFNFCFRNGNYEWDNNQSFNYISGIEPVASKPEVTEINNEVTEELVEALDSDLIIEILDNLLEENLNKTVSEETTNKQQILDEILSENVAPVNTPAYIEEFNMDDLVESILNPIINFSLAEEDDSLSGVEDFGGIVEETAVAGGIVEGGLGTVEVETSIPEQETEFTSASLAETTENVGGEESTGTDLITTPEDTYLVSPRKLRKFYLLRKKIKLALYKLVVSIPKLLAGTFDEDRN